MKIFLAVLVIVGQLAADGGAWAGERESGDAPSRAALEEVVLKDGSLYRGTISEVVAGDYVSLVTVSGKTLNFPVSQIEYYGPLGETEQKREKTQLSSGLSLGTQFKLRVRGKVVPVKFESRQKGLTFMLHTMTAEGSGWSSYTGTIHTTTEGYSRVCTAPCEVDITEGRYRFGLAIDNHVVEAGEVDIDGPVVVEGEYTDNTAIRVMGWVLAGVSLIAGTAMMFQSVSSDSYDIDNGLMIGGGSLMAGGTLISLVLVLWPDSGEVRIRG